MKWICYVVQGLLTLGFLMSGLTKIFSSADQIREMFTDPLGYAPAYIYAIGVVETIAALALIAGYWSRRAAAGASLVLAVIMVGAIVSHLIANAAADAVLPAVYLVLLTLLLVRLIRYEAVVKFWPQRI